MLQPASQLWHVADRCSNMDNEQSDMKKLKEVLRGLSFGLICDDGNFNVDH